MACNTVRFYLYAKPALKHDNIATDHLFSLQVWLGFFGPILIHVPVSANYEEDMDPILLSDWSHQTPYKLYSYALTKSPP